MQNGKQAILLLAAWVDDHYPFECESAHLDGTFPASVPYGISIAKRSERGALRTRDDRSRAYPPWSSPLKG